jgi:hypothetical protein
VSEILMKAALAKEGPVEAGKLTYLGGLQSRGEPTQLCAAFGGVKMPMKFVDFEA